MTMKQALTLTAALAVLTGAAAPQASAAPLHHKPALLAAKPCTTTWEVTGRKVAVRRPAWNDGPVAKTTSPVHHYCPAETGWPHASSRLPGPRVVRPTASAAIRGAFGA
jgi:hypothetical protein